MTDVHKTLYDFWMGFTDDGQPIPAYLTGHVPDKTPFPYITFEVVEGDFLGGNVLTAFCWLKADNGYNVNAHAAAFLDQVKKAISRFGTILKAGDGYIAMYPNPSGFLSYVDDQTNRDIVGARVSYEILYFA